jgi:L-seryl-tRNA(Ser) seleniumtransferase
MRVHPSNYVIAGFAEEVPLADLVSLARKRNVYVIDDIGSGALVDYAEYGLSGEPIARACIAEGADLVLFSGDKLLAGPQCGIILGRRKLIEQITNHPLTRALRVDKVTLAALAATLRLYRQPENAKQTIPLLQLLSTSPDNLKNRAERLAPQLESAAVVASAAVEQGVSYLGGGSVPTQQVPTWCVALTPAKDSVDSLARNLRMATPSICGRIQQDRLWLDLRSVFPGQDMEIVQAIQSLPGEEEVAEAEAE